ASCWWRRSANSAVRPASGRYIRKGPPTRIPRYPWSTAPVALCRPPAPWFLAPA
ncbi:uncharacterized protein METZ01_LOCUS223062, partial [marine metagenome]